MKMYIVIWLIVGNCLLGGITAQEQSQSLNGGQDEFRPETNLPEGKQNPGQGDGGGISTTINIPTIKFNTNEGDKQHPDAQETGNDKETPETMASLVFIAAIVAVCVVGCIAFVGGMYCWYKHADMSSSARRVLYRSSDASVLIHNDYQPMGDGHETIGNGHVGTNNDMARLAEKTDYPAYGVTGPNPLHYFKGPPIDVNLNRNAEVYHYQQQKQRLKSLNSVSSNGSSHPVNGTTITSNDPNKITTQASDEENSDGEYTVYECPGLASRTEGPLEIHNPLFADSEASFSSYTTPSLGGSIVASTYDYSTTVGGHG